MATVTITGRNDAPVAASDTASTGATTRLTLPAAALLVNDSDPDTGDTLHLSSVDGTGTHRPRQPARRQRRLRCRPRLRLAGRRRNGDRQLPLRRRRHRRRLCHRHGAGGGNRRQRSGHGGRRCRTRPAKTIVWWSRRLACSTNDRDPDLHDVLRVVAVDGRAAAIGQALVLASGAQVTIFASGRVEYDPGSVWNALSVGETGSDQIGYSVVRRPRQRLDRAGDDHHRGDERPAGGVGRRRGRRRGRQGAYRRARQRRRSRCPRRADHPLSDPGGAGRHPDSWERCGSTPTTP